MSMMKLIQILIFFLNVVSKSSQPFLKHRAMIFNDITGFIWSCFIQGRMLLQRGVGVSPPLGNVKSGTLTALHSADVYWTLFLCSPI